jgi:replicative DNA helicase
MTRKSAPTAKYVTGEAVFAGWRENVLTGIGPVVFPHTLPVPEISPGHVVLLGGAPGGGKTALVMACVVEALRHTPTLRALVVNVEMSPAALLDRQLARLSGIEAEVIRHRRFTAEHADRLDAGLATVETFADRLAFLESPFDLENVAHAVDAHGADVIVLDYLQRILPPGDVTDTRLRVNATMDMLRRFAAAGCAVLALSAVAVAVTTPAARPTLLGLCRWQATATVESLSTVPTTLFCSPPSTTPNRTSCGCRT